MPPKKAENKTENKPTKKTKTSKKKTKRPPNAWATLVKKTMDEKNLKMKEAIKYIKDNNLYTPKEKK